MEYNLRLSTQGGAALQCACIVRTEYMYVCVHNNISVKYSFRRIKEVTLHSKYEFVLKDISENIPCYLNVFI